MFQLLHSSALWIHTQDHLEVVAVRLVPQTEGMHARQYVPHAAGIRCAHFGRLHNFAFHTTAQWERHLIKLTLILQGTVEFSVGAESREQFSRQRVCQRTKICIHVQHMALCANNIPTAATIDAHRASGRAYKKTSHNCTRTSQSHHHYVQNEEWQHNNPWQSFLDAMPGRKPLFLGEGRHPHRTRDAAAVL